MDIARLPVDPGPCAWNLILPPGPLYPSVAGDMEADVVIVGGGFAGLAAAHRLRDQGVQRVVLLEARRIGEGPAGRNSGFMIDLPHELNSDDYSGGGRREIGFNRVAIDYAEHLAQRYQMPRAVFDRSGRMTGAVTDQGRRQLAAYQDELSDLGESFQTLDGAALKNITGTDGYQAGLYTPGAAMIQPAAFVRALAQPLASSIFERSPVTALQRRANQWHLTTPGGTVRAPNIILAVNGHVESFGYFSRRLLHVFTYASMTRALSDEESAELGGRADWGMLPADPMGTTVRRFSANRQSRIVIRNHVTLNQSLEASAADMRRAATRQDRSFLARFPMLQSVPFEYRWGGRLCLSLNSVPAFGELEPGLFSACCQNGLGTVKGMLGGMLAADLATGGSDLARTYAEQQAPKRLPPEPFLSVGARVALGVKAWRAGREL